MKRTTGRMVVEVSEEESAEDREKPIQEEPTEPDLDWIKTMPTHGGQTTALNKFFKKFWP